MPPFDKIRLLLAPIAPIVSVPELLQSDPAPVTVTELLKKFVALAMTAFESVT